MAKRFKILGTRHGPFPFHIHRAFLCLAATGASMISLVYSSGPIDEPEVALELGPGIRLELVRIPAGEFSMGETDWSRELIGLFAPHDLRARNV
ncbi:MAG: hypothetical protein L0312_32240, partial [Acidobacteria bacterium]|nr:hypothetical protein [Acidobacteriota bacterium]